MQPTNNLHENKAGIQNIFETCRNISFFQVMKLLYLPGFQPLSVPSPFAQVYPIFQPLSHKTFIFAFCNYSLFQKLGTVCIKLNRDTFLISYPNQPIVF